MRKRTFSLKSLKKLIGHSITRPAKNTTECKLKISQPLRNESLNMTVLADHQEEMKLVRSLLESSYVKLIDISNVIDTRDVNKQIKLTQSILKKLKH